MPRRGLCAGSSRWENQPRENPGAAHACTAARPRPPLCHLPRAPQGVGARGGPRPCHTLHAVTSPSPVPGVRLPRPHTHTAPLTGLSPDAVPTPSLHPLVSPQSWSLGTACLPPSRPETPTLQAGLARGPGLRPWEGLLLFPGAGADETTAPRPGSRASTRPNVPGDGREGPLPPPPAPGPHLLGPRGGSCQAGDVAHAASTVLGQGEESGPSSPASGAPGALLLPLAAGAPALSRSPEVRAAEPPGRSLRPPSPAPSRGPGRPGAQAAGGRGNRHGPDPTDRTSGSREATEPLQVHGPCG